MSYLRQMRYGTTDDMSFYGPSAAKQPKLSQLHDGRNGYKNSPYARQAPGILGPTPFFQSNVVNNHFAAGNKRQFNGYGPGNAWAESGHSVPGEFQTFHGPTAAKQQKRDAQSSRTMPQAAGDNRAFQGELQSANPDTAPGFQSSMRDKPGLLGRCPQPPQLAFLPASRLPASNTGGKSSNEGPKPAMDSLPEVPAEQKINRINAELDALEKEFNRFMFSGNVLAGPHLNSQRSMQTYRKKRRALQNQLREENERQRVENLQLSKQLEQQYNLSLGSSRVPSAETTNGDDGGKGGSEEVEESHGALSNEIDKLTRQRNDVEDLMEGLISRDCLTKDEQHQLNSLYLKQKSFDKRLCTVSKKRDKLLKQSLGNFRTDAFDILGKLSRDVQAWRKFKLSEWNAAQHEVRRTGMGRMMSSTWEESQEDDDVVVISDDDENIQVIDSSNFSNRETHQHASYEQKQHNIPRSVRVIDRCVNKSGMASVADQSHFVLSGLASILLRRQRDRKQALSQSDSVKEPSASLSAVQEPCAVSQLVNQMSSSLRLVTHHNAKIRKNIARDQRNHQKQVQAETINMYMKLLNEKK